MNLSNLIQWAKDNADPKKLKKEMVRTVGEGANQQMLPPTDGDILIAQKFLKEIEKRANLAIENTKRVERYYRDITEYLENLDKRGLKYDEKGGGIKLDSGKKEK